MILQGYNRTRKGAVVVLVMLSSLFSVNDAFSSQVVEHRFYMRNAGSFKMRGKLYVCGLKEKANLYAVVFCCDSNLNVLDSAEFLLGKQKTADFGTTEIDSLHGHLQIQLPYSNLKGIILLRLSCDLKTSELIKDLEPGRINSLARFSKERLELPDGIIELRKQQDSAGLQYYLNLYKIKSTSGNYEYKQVWQLPLPKKNLVAVELLAVDARFVFLALSFMEANKFKVILNKYNLSQGHLVSSYFVAESAEQYRLGLLRPVAKGEWIALGQVQTKTELKMWHMRLDSLQVKSGPISTPLPYQAKTGAAATIVLDFCSLQEHSTSQKLLVTANLYTVDAADRCCLFLPDLQLEVSTAKAAVRVVPAINFPTAIYELYKSSDKAERSGKRGLVKPLASSTYFQLEPLNEVFATAVGSGLPSQTYFCSKTEAKKQKRVYYQISQTGRVVQKKTLETVDLLQSPKTLFYSKYKVIVCSQTSADTYLAKLYNW